MQSKSLHNSDRDASVKENGRFLANVLKANAVFSTVSGLIFIFFASSVAHFIGLENPVFLIGIGVTILFFSVYVYKVATMDTLNTKLVWVIIELDILWVVGSVILLLTNIVSLTTLGQWAIGLTAEIVAVFAILEYVGLRKASS